MNSNCPAENDLTEQLNIFFIKYLIVRQYNRLVVFSIIIIYIKEYNVKVTQRFI